MFLALDKDMNGTLKIFMERAFDKHVWRGKNGGGGDNAQEMDFENFLDFFGPRKQRYTGKIDIFVSVS
uniref:Uncharacterized protein n=1 Tax=Nelumbo nucifera TaxID=4432 RepID=A0A822XHU4_NELNU|nr:TPA_asm: hypothetical protein HUJ06_020995 [Nelumbo nucifera]